MRDRNRVRDMVRDRVRDRDRDRDRVRVRDKDIMRESAYSSLHLFPDVVDGGVDSPLPPLWYRRVCSVL